jgi:hypothetical protein
MPLFRSERGIGRGEIAESRIEAPFFAAFMVGCAILLLLAHLYFANNAVTIVLGISMVVFGTTVVRVDYGVYILVIAMLLSPEVFLGYAGDRPLNIRYDDVLIGVIFVGVLVKLSFEGKHALWRPSPVNVGIVAYYGVCCVSTLLALRANLPAWDKRSSFFVMLKMLEFYMVFVVVGDAIRTREEVRKQITLFLTVGLVICAYGLVTMRSGERVTAPFESMEGTEPNTLGGYLMLVMSTTIGLYVYAPTRKLKTLFASLTVLAFVPFLYTLSRASYIALLAAMTTAGIFGRKLVILAVVALILILSPVLMPKEIMDRVNYTFQRGAGEPLKVAGRDTGLQVDKSTHERIYIWRKVSFILHVAPWFGGGISWESVMDSQYARVILETGLFGLAAFLFLQWRLFRAAREAHRWSRDWLCRGIALGSVAGTIGVIVHAMGTISFLIIRIMEPYWFLIALTVVARSLAIEDYARRARAARMASAPAQDAGDNAPRLPEALAPARQPGLVRTVQRQPG